MANLFSITNNLEPPPIPRIYVNSSGQDLIYPEDTQNYPKDQLSDDDIYSSYLFKDSDELISEPTQKKVTNVESSKGSKSFEENFEKALEIDPSIKKYKNFLVKTAKIESGFNSHVQNKSGAPYYGYFQMGKNEIALTTKMSVEQFRNNPVAQILGACKLYELNLRTIKKLGVYELGKQRGFSDDALVAGAWLGGPGGVKKFLQGRGDPSDSHWYGGKGGTSVGKRMREFNE